MTTPDLSKAFTPLQLKGLTLKNRFINPGIGDFDRFSLSNVAVSFDTEHKVIAFRGETERYNEKKAEVLLTLKYDKGLKCAISIKFLRFSFGNAFVTFASHGRYNEIASDFTLLNLCKCQTYLGFKNPTFGNSRLF